MSADPHEAELHNVSLPTEVKVELDFNPEDDPPDQFYSICGDQGETSAVVKHEETTRKSSRVQQLLSLSDLESWDDMNDGDWKCDVVKVKSKIKKGKSTKRNVKSKENGIERRRKLIKDRTPEEKEMQRSKWRDESRRKRKVKKIQGNNLEAEDGVVGKKRVKGISDLTQEKQELVRERWRKKSRQKRESERMCRDEIKAIPNSDVDDSDGNGDKERLKVSRISKQSCKQGSRKKKVSEMTPEELEASRTKWREKKKKVSEMTPEELTIYREKSREKMRKWRERKRKEQMTPEEKERLKKKVNERSRSYRAKLSDEAKKRINERLRQKRSQMTEQERQEKLQRNKMWYLQNKAKMTEEQLAVERMKNYMRYVARRARMTPEEIKAEQLKNYQTKRRRFENMTEEEKQMYRERLNERCRIYKRSRGQRRKWEQAKVKPNETQEERRERLNSISHRKATRRRMTVKQMLDSGMTMEEVNQKFQIEADKRRERRLAINRKSLEKAKLKKQLLATGVPEEEIEAKLKEFSDNYQFKGRKREAKRVRHQRINLEDFNMPSDSDPIPSVTTVMEKDTNVVSSAVGSKPSLESNINAIHVNSMMDSVNLSNYVQEDVTSQTACSFASTPENEEIFASSVQPLQPPRPDQTSHFQYQYTSISQNHQFQEPQLPLQYETLSTSYTQAPSYTCYENDTLTSQSLSTVPEEHNQISQEIKSDPTTPTKPCIGKRKLGRPRKGDPTNTKKKKGDGPKRVLLGMSIGSRRIENRDEICDECGNAYSAVYLKAHKRHMHNSNFKNGECTICGEKFKRSEHFYLHWRRKHCADARAKTGAQKTYMCQDCGKLFQSAGSLQAHWNQEHGPRSLKDNFLKCSVCPDPKKLYKTKLLLQLHMQNCHKGYEMYECVRCPEKFRSNKDLNDHIMGNHPDSYWPCKYCNTVKYTELGLTFHYSDRKCHKIPKEELEKIRKEIGNASVDRFPFQCNFCDQEVQCAGLNKHYRKVHGVGQDEFQCVKCDKTFKKREYWGVHMIDIHNVDVEECKEIMNKNKFNLKNMTNVTIKNLGKKKGRLKSVKAAGRGRDGGGTRGRKKKCVDKTDDGKEDDDEDEIEVKWKKRKKTRSTFDDEACDGQVKKELAGLSVTSSLSEVEIPRQLRRDCRDDGIELDDKYVSKPLADTVVTRTNLRQSAQILEEPGKKTEDEREMESQIKAGENTNDLNGAVMESNPELNFTHLVSLVDLDVDKIVIIKREVIENEKDNVINENGSGE